MSLFITPSKIWFQRAAAVMVGKEQMLWGLNSLAARLRSKFLNKRIDFIKLDFKAGLAGDLPISAAICRIFLQKGIHSVNFQANGLFSLDKSEYPNSTMKAAIRAGLRTLALNGLPATSKPVELDLSWGMPSDETQPSFTITASVTISQRAANAATIDFYYLLARDEI